ncbi:tripartite-type tricarboxylate transporter receptor subunit TctC [Variovorax sp. TBS-050B]|uniref:tripartite tricarboxylate transporter substrate-binding protein n=1 Tax=Variovorax sp. TBS-050B TaxID=2940551 RepID=UPI00247407A7|nr:tripartite tricarboxylate transporter substrate-binding protein [Variovorax sp. TBS-050B]MDH6590642.1 tripartite-type tricarboxylate transporter receptor subunit TctC [Variovorax sp. TBS-050B]
MDASSRLSRRAFAQLALAVPLAGRLLPAAAQGGTAPGRLLVGYPPGGTLDTTARQLVEAWRRQGRSYMVDNRVGAAGRIASSLLKRERPDAGTLLCTQTSALTIYPHVYTRLMYDPAKDLQPVSPVVTATCALGVSGAVPASVKNLQDYLAWVRHAPAHASYASPAAGSVAHFLGYRLSEAAGLKLEHVGYRGSAPAMQDLIGGQIPAYFGFVADFLPYMAQGRIRILAVSGEKRSRFLPQVPTFAEQGFAAIRGAETYGIFAPPGTPEATLNALHASIERASRDPALVAAFEQVGLEPGTLAPRDYAALIEREREAWGPAVRASGFRFEE